MKNVGSVAVRLNEAFLSSRRPRLIAAYSLAREFATYTALLPLLPLLPLARGRKKFIVYSQPRTGSTLLVDLLDSHPDIHCEREILAFTTLLTKPFLQARRSLHPRQIYGCKISNHQLERQVSRSCISAFLKTIQEEGWSIIHLRRENIVRQALSLLLADMTKVRHLETGKIRLREQVRISPEELYNRVKETERWTQHDQGVFTGLPHLELIYERDLLRTEQHQITSNRAFEFLALASAPVQTRFVKLSPDPLSELVANLPELKERFKCTEYASFFQRIA